MSSAKKKRPVLPQSRQQDQINKRALVWIGAAFVVIVVVVAVLLVWNA